MTTAQPAQQTVQGAVEAQAEAKKSIAYARVQRARDWFAAAVPSHIDPDQYVAVVLGLLQKDDKLREAAEGSPESLMVAAAECARLGLVPGDTYHFVPFYNKERKRQEITGIIDYKGEIELIYRGGAVESVHAEVVRSGDKFAWRPGMQLPEHTVGANEYGQIGLLGEGKDDRGILTGVYAYARLRGGGISKVVVMSVAEVMKHRDVAKTDKFWGPEWPEEGPWTPQMWLKTAVHGLPTWVPTNVEYVTELWRATAAVAAAPVSVEAPAERPAIMPPDSGPRPVGPTVRGAVEAARTSTRTASRRPREGAKDHAAGAAAPSGGAAGDAS